MHVCARTRLCERERVTHTKTGVNDGVKYINHVRGFKRHCKYLHYGLS